MFSLVSKVSYFFIFQEKITVPVTHSFWSNAVCLFFRSHIFFQTRTLFLVISGILFFRTYFLLAIFLPLFFRSLKVCIVMNQVSPHFVSTYQRFDGGVKIVRQGIYNGDCGPVIVMRYWRTFLQRWSFCPVGGLVISVVWRLGHCDTILFSGKVNIFCGKVLRLIYMSQPCDAVCCWLLVFWFSVTSVIGSGN